MTTEATYRMIEREVEIPSGDRAVRGTLVIPQGAAGVVAFAHGSGSGRLSPRNRLVAGILQQAKLATLLVDLLEDDEAEDRSLVFDIPLLADRLRSAAAWLAGQSETQSLPIGFFGASTGAGAALLAASRSPGSVRAIVSRGGRPDLARQALGQVTAPTLLIVGSEDATVLDLNRQAQARLHCVSRLEIVADATHLFSEPGALEEVARLSEAWFTRYLKNPSSSA